MIAEIETDKATMEVEAVDEGRIEKLLVAEGTEHVPVNQPIAMLFDEDDDAAAFEERSAHRSPGERTRRNQPRQGEGDHPPSPEAAHLRPLPKGRGRAGSAEQVMHKIAEQIRANGANGHAKRIFASPLARRLARERGHRACRAQRLGPHGRIVKADVERAARTVTRSAGASSRAVEAEPPRPWRSRQAPSRARARARASAMRARAARLSDAKVLALYEPGSYELVPHDTMRRFIAERLTLSKQTIPHFYLAIDCDLDALLAARARLNALAPQEGPRAFRLSVNDFIIKALAMALQTVPAANATWTEGGLLRHRASDIAVAVALEGGGLHHAGNPQCRGEEPVGDL